jgi:hypothetical protein
VLLTAAALKTHQLATDPALGVLYGDRWLSLGLVQFEVGLAICLVSGIYPTRVRSVALLTFVTFALVSAYLGLTNAASCGCFGQAHVNPWITAGLDLILAILLWCWSPQRVAHDAHLARKSRRVLVWTLLIWAVAAIPAFVAFTRYRLAEHAVGVAADDDVVLLEPEKWVGNHFPLQGDIDIGDRLAAGSWLVVLHHHDCSQCQAVLPLYEQLASDEEHQVKAFRVALIEVPPYAANGLSRRGVSEYGRLSEGREWFVTTPAEIVLRDGLVVDARTGNDVDLASAHRSADVLRHGASHEP